ncbi:MAG TPA: hypothetical protein VNR86_09640 [Sphingomicrobium sp.]|nr:hypothetical protein [Sphingomicrobium sp.]
MSRIVFVTAGILIASLAATSPARASYLPAPSELITPGEQALLGDAVRAVMSGNEEGSAAQIALLDSILAKDVEPTKFRGYNQMIRSNLLLDADRNIEAMAAADEAVRLLPGYSGPLLTAMQAYAYSDKAGQAADFLLRASDVDPDAVKEHVDDYDMFNLINRLRAAKDEHRLQIVSDRILAIGWRGQKFDSRSDLATQAIKLHLGKGDVAGARALVPELIEPEQTYDMLASNRYREIWPDLEKWAGPKLARQWELYLTESRSRWSASHAPEAADAYLNALLTAGRYSDVASDILPAFSNLGNARDYDLLFRVSGVARALVGLGRWNDVRTLYAAAERTWPLGKDVNALNVTGNEARYALSMGEPKRALDLIDRTIAEAQRTPQSINSDAIIGMHLARTCILHELGRGSEAGSSMAIASGTGDTESAVKLRLCIGDMNAARDVLIRALADDSHRDGAIALLQPDGAPLSKSPFELRLRNQWDRLRSDPKVLAELSKYGRILPFTVNEAAHFAPATGKGREKPAPPAPVTLNVATVSPPRAA